MKKMVPRAKTAQKQRNDDQAENKELLEQKKQIEHIMKSQQYLAAPNSALDKIGGINNKINLNSS
jgi:hypothetical protein